MKRLLFYTLILATPFVIMVLVNEATKTNSYTVSVFGTPVKALNPKNKMKSKCTWDCHNRGCSHRNNNQISIGPINTMREKIINGLGVSKGGNTYKNTNVLYLVILWPLIMFGLLVANIELFLNRKKK